jgi:hypothetical protein
MVGRINVYISFWWAAMLPTLRIADVECHFEFNFFQKPIKMIKILQLNFFLSVYEDLRSWPHEHSWYATCGLRAAFLRPLLKIGGLKHAARMWPNICVCEARAHLKN